MGLTIVKLLINNRNEFIANAKHKITENGTLKIYMVKVLVQRYI